MAGETYDAAYFTSDDTPNDYGPDLPYDWQHRQVQMRETVKDIQAMCLPFTTVLDVGCATGLLIRALVQEGYDAQGVDTSTWAMDNADAAVKDRVHGGDACDLKYSESEFDLVTCLDTLEHLTHDQASAALTHITRVAKREIVLRMPYAMPVEWLANPDPKALAEPTGDASHTLVVPVEYWLWQIQRRGWLTSHIVYAAGLCMLPRVVYLVARRPAFQYKGRDIQWNS
jgi:ubiquinone/menaquinone biosynthesis C-methylase UbiE